MTAPSLKALEIIKAIRGYIGSIETNLAALEAVAKDLEREAGELRRAKEERGGDGDKPATEAQIRYLHKFGLKPARDLTRKEASEILTKLTGR